jgi:phosphoribosylglycinamide formyltransferase 1
MGLRLVCLASGRGSNFAALCAAGRAGQLGGAQVVGLVVNRPGCGALDHAQRDAVPTAVVDHTTASDRADFEAQLLQAIEPMNPDLLVFAGFMRILTPYFLSRAPAPGVNLHPSLLPAFPGAHAIDEAYAAQVRVSGCTTHLVTPTVDAGPILMQGVVPLNPGDSLDDFADRMHAMEHQLLPASVRAIAEGSLRIEAENLVCLPDFSAWISAK